MLEPGQSAPPRSERVVALKNMKRLYSGFCLLVLFGQVPLVFADPLDQWHWRNPLPNGNSVGNALTYAKSQFVGVGYGNVVSISPDGLNWTQPSSATS